MSMMIDIQDLGKQYRINTGTSYLSLRDELYRTATGLFRKKKEKQEFWALDHINLQVAKGERVGIIGRNGAGKSTLLKIISRITPPTKGSITINGRVASLLEVGTGFHPELTGRENIYFNGSILGLKRSEINNKLDAIIDFSGIEKFIDTPLKHYSSGMQLRLAFSVAAHLEPEVLLIDEVLAVGDMEFQKKCIGKMEEVSRADGRTILFVSHNMNYISSICNKGVFLDKGSIVFSGNIPETIKLYSDSTGNGAQGQVKISHPEFIFKGIDNFNSLQDLDASSELDVRLFFSVGQLPATHLFFDFAVYNERGEMVIHSRARHSSGAIKTEPGKEIRIKYFVSSPNLAPGNYFITIFVYEEVYEQNIIAWIENYPLCYVSSKNPYAIGSGTENLQDIRSLTYPKSSISIV